ncbi:MAG: EAL domain-containing protein [Phycisphaerae bacterium]|nr:EAL domain-containing protein [Phycisphaerae bacterium]
MIGWRQPIDYVFFIYLLAGLGPAFYRPPNGVWAQKGKLVHTLSIRDQVFRQFFESSPTVALVVDLADGKIVAANAAAITFYGWPHDTLLSMTMSQINTMPPDGMAKLLAHLNQAKSGLFHFQHRLASGEVVDVESSNTAIEVAGRRLCLVIVHDLSEQKRAEESLWLARRAMDASATGLTIADGRQPDLPLIYANPAFLQMTGYTRDEVQGRNCRFLQNDDRNQPELDTLRAAIKKGQPCEVILRNYRKDGTAFWNEITIAPVFDAAGLITHYIGTQKDISDRKAAEAHVERLAYFDSLTDLPNRRLFLDRLASNLALSIRNDTHGVAAVLDLDNFKNLNDAEGPDMGDLLLREIASRLQSCLREGDTAARLGGDEFAILLTNLSADGTTAAQLGRTILERIGKSIEVPLALGSIQHQLTTSIGAVVFPTGKEAPADILQKANTALDRSKAAGKNTISYFEAAMQDHVQRRVTMERDLRTAVESGEFRMFLQPQVLGNGTIIGAEALIRWQHPTKGLVPPLDFIPVAEETGLIVDIGEWIFRQACQTVKRLEAWNNGLRIAVNVSPRQFRMANFPTRMAAIIEEVGIKPHQVAMEVTEAVFFDNLSHAVATMNELKSLGVRLSLDDFGTGYSSLSYLQKLPIAELKIDRSFIKDAPTNPNDAALVEAILAVARQRKLDVVAEGVESVKHVDFLKSRGCRVFQGYYFGRPVPAEEFVAAIEKPQVDPSAG